MEYKLIIKDLGKSAEATDEIAEAAFSAFEDITVSTSDREDHYIVTIPNQEDGDPEVLLEKISELFKSTSFQIAAFTRADFDCWVSRMRDESGTPITFEGEIPKTNMSEEDMVELESLIENAETIFTAMLILDEIEKGLKQVSAELELAEMIAKAPVDELAAFFQKSSVIEGSKAAFDKVADFAAIGAIHSNNIENLRFILNKVTAKHALIEQDEYALFHAACKANHMKAVKEIVKACDPKKLQFMLVSNGYSAFAVAHHNENLELAQFLISICDKADVPKMVAGQGYHALAVACEKGNKALVDLNFQHCGKDNIQQMIFSKPSLLLLESLPFLAACEGGHEEVAIKLYKEAASDGLRGLRTIAESVGFNIEKLEAARKEMIAAKTAATVGSTCLGFFGATTKSEQEKTEAVRLTFK